MIYPTLHCPCRNSFCLELFRYTSPPIGETPFPFSGSYIRYFDECQVCGHMYGRHEADMSLLYDQTYVDATYGGSEGMRHRFEKIMALPHHQSDNRARVSRVLEFSAQRKSSQLRTRLLDVGAGIGVFPAAMQEAGWSAIALEPDPRTVIHLREVVKVEALCDDVRNLSAENCGRFDLITFNKVLEHVGDPVKLLIAARELMAVDGFIYIEVPDVAAAQISFEREEFFIEHLHVFSPASLANMAELAGLQVQKIERIVEPSSKCTLVGFLQV